MLKSKKCNFRKIGVFVSVILVLLANVSCRSSKATLIPSPSQDVRTDVRTETIFVTDTVFVEVPEQMAERTTLDGRSFLENDYASSNAWINDDGSLHHDLQTKQQQIASPFQKPVEKRDSIVYVTKKESYKVTVEKELTWLQQFKQHTYIYLLLITAVLLAYTFRKNLVELVKKIV